MWDRAQGSGGGPEVTRRWEQRVATVIPPQVTLRREHRVARRLPGVCSGGGARGFSRGSSPEVTSTTRSLDAGQQKDHLPYPGLVRGVTPGVVTSVTRRSSRRVAEGTLSAHNLSVQGLPRARFKGATAYATAPINHQASDFLVISLVFNTCELDLTIATLLSTLVIVNKYIERNQTVDNIRLFCFFFIDYSFSLIYYFCIYFLL